VTGLSNTKPGLQAFEPRYRQCALDRQPVRHPGHRTPSDLHHKILFWGVLRALVMRGFFVIAGTALLRNFHWTIYVFGGLFVDYGTAPLFSAGEPPPAARCPPILRMSWTAVI
jgi:hypothetical protein